MTRFKKWDQFSVFSNLNEVILGIVQVQTNFELNVNPHWNITTPKYMSLKHALFKMRQLVPFLKPSYKYAKRGRKVVREEVADC